MCIFRCKKAAETTTEENHGWIWWWVLATCIIILITIVCQLHSGKYYFDKDKYPIVGEWIDDSAIRTPSTDWEDMCLEAEAEDVINDGDVFQILTTPSDFNKVNSNLIKLS